MVPEGRRYIHRYVGHANVQTDIKEVTYLGTNDELVAAGEDVSLAFDYLRSSSKSDHERPYGVLVVPHCCGNPAQVSDHTLSAGSDDGRVYIWDARSGAVICALEADEDIVNSVAAHPTLPYLATSGIEDKVRIWGPRSSVVNQDLSEQIQKNQVGSIFLHACASMLLL